MACDPPISIRLKRISIAKDTSYDLKSLASFMILISSLLHYPEFSSSAAPSTC